MFIKYAFFVFLFFFCLFGCFLKLKIYWYTLDYTGGWAIKQFSPGRFPEKRLHFFWPEYNVWNQHWIGSYLIQGSPNTLIYFKSKPSYFSKPIKIEIFLFFVRPITCMMLFYKGFLYELQMLVYYWWLFLKLLSLKKT